MNEIPLITRLVIKNYRSLLDVDVALTPLTVLVGKNGVGKSNVINVLHFVRDGLMYGFDKAVTAHGGMSSLLCWFVDESEHIRIELCLDGASWSGEYAFSFGASKKNGCEITSERLTYKEKNRDKHLSVSNGNGCEQAASSLDNLGKSASPLFEVLDGKLIRLPELIERVRQSNPNASHRSLTVSKSAFYLSEVAAISPPAKRVRDFLVNMSFYDLSPAFVRTPQKATLPMPLLENGSNLATVLLEIQKGKKDYLITQALKVAVEGIEGYSILPVGQHLVTKLHYRFLNGKVREVISDLSDEASGTIRILATLAALYQQRFPSLLSIEEAEKEIHPDALELLGDMLEVATDSYQVIITTHSPDLITYLPADSLRVVDKVAGLTKIAPISKEQYDTIAENIFSAGGLMRLEGLERKEEPILE
ncbi:MAG: AAA family ATPase [Ardenticatenaceae bacterium]